MVPSRIFMAERKHLFLPALKQSGSKTSMLKYTEGDPPARTAGNRPCMQAVFCSGGNLIPRNYVLEKASRATCVYEHFTSLPCCKFSTQPHSTTVKLLITGAVMLSASSLHSNHVVYGFPKCLITPRASCPTWRSMFNLLLTAAPNLTRPPLLPNKLL